jgi:hypothetical protein
MKSATARVLSLVLVLALGGQGVVFGENPWLYGQDSPPGMQLAFASKLKHKKKSEADSESFSREDFQKRGADLDNFIYVVFDPKAEPALKGSSAAMAETQSSSKVWWIMGGAAILVGAGVAGYFLFAPHTVKSYSDYSDSSSAGN